MEEFTEQGLASLAWAFAKAEHKGDKTSVLVDAIAIEAAKRDLHKTDLYKTDLNKRNLSALAWVFAKAEHMAPAQLDVAETAYSFGPSCGRRFLPHAALMERALSNHAKSTSSLIHRGIL